MFNLHCTSVTPRLLLLQYVCIHQPYIQYASSGVSRLLILRVGRTTQLLVLGALPLFRSLLIHFPMMCHRERQGVRDLLALVRAAG